MNKVKFNKIVRNYYQVPESDRVQLEKLAAEYPYSQVIHTLVAKSHHDAGTELAESTLHYAAMYTTDRHQLRFIIESKTPVLINRKVDEHVPEKQETDDMMANLATLKANRAAYEKMIATDVEKKEATTKAVTPQRLSKTKKTTPKKKEKESAAVAKSTTKAPVRKGTAAKKDTTAASKKTTASKTPPKKTAAAKTVGRPKKTSSKTTSSKKKSTATSTREKGQTTGKTTKPVAAAKKSATKESKKTTASTKAGKQSKKKEPKSTNTTGGTKKKTVVKKKSEPLPVKRKDDPPAREDQRIIIEQFIEKQPSLINKQMVVAQNQEDLSVKSTLVNEDLISENLAQIYLNQGKKNKALEIYKKLIWKFPQKKAYFAARIEELKKKG